MPFSGMKSGFLEVPSSGQHGAAGLVPSGKANVMAGVAGEIVRGVPAITDRMNFAFLQKPDAIERGDGHRHEEAAIHLIFPL